MKKKNEYRKPLSTKARGYEINNNTFSIELPMKTYMTSGTKGKTTILEQKNSKEKKCARNNARVDTGGYTRQSISAKMKRKASNI